jgi:hypothetical protein
MPTFTFLKNGNTVYRFEGAMQDALVYWIDELKDRKTVTPADLAVLVEKAPQITLGSLLKRSASMLLFPVAIIILVLLWSGLYVFLFAKSFNQLCCLFVYRPFISVSIFHIHHVFYLCSFS